MSEELRQILDRLSTPDGIQEALAKEDARRQRDCEGYPEWVKWFRRTHGFS